MSKGRKFTALRDVVCGEVKPEIFRVRTNAKLVETVRNVEIIERTILK